ncbi:MAG: histidine phosphatase family protein [Candidatus Liptonbacteria bacterium]|nr:histidine phosphatase family protein [Candidatus Liptonbacteria bacterium]
MLRLYIARHGQDEDNANGILNGRRDMPLTKLGVRQAEQLAKNIKERKLAFDAVYTSPLVRARRTAEIVAAELGMKAPVALEDLTEMDFGVMTGKRVQDIEKLCAPDIIKADPVVYFINPQGAETFPQAIERGKRVISWVKGKHTDGNVLLVCHGDIGKMMYAAYYHLDWETILRMFHFGNSELLLLAEDSPAEETHVFAIEQRNH